MERCESCDRRASENVRNAEKISKIKPPNPSGVFETFTQVELIEVVDQTELAGKMTFAPRLLQAMAFELTSPQLVEPSHQRF
jgi:hypothetical protein